MPTSLPSATPMVRRARAVLFAGAIGATAIGGAACTKEPQGQPPQIPPQPEPTAVAMYGATPPPEVDAGTTAVPPQPGPPPTGPVAMYGAAPPPRKP